MYETISSYCSRCSKNRVSKTPEVLKTKSGKRMLLSKYEACNSKNSSLFKSNKSFDGNKNTESKCFTHNNYFILKV